MKKSTQFWIYLMVIAMFVWLAILGPIVALLQATGLTIVLMYFVFGFAEGWEENPKYLPKKYNLIYKLNKYIDEGGR